MNEAMVRIRYELGNDAIIVSNRWIRQKGIRNFLKKKVLEVTAAVDQNSPSPSKELEQKSQEQNLEKQLKELKNMVNQLMSENLKDRNTNENENMEKFINHLEKIELDEKIIGDFSNYCKSLDPSHLDLDMLYQYFGNLLNKRILSEKYLLKKFGPL